MVEWVKEVKVSLNDQDIKLWELKLHQFEVVNSFTLTCSSSDIRKQEVREALQMLYEYIRKSINDLELIRLLDNTAKNYKLEVTTECSEAVQT